MFKVNRILLYNQISQKKPAIFAEKLPTKVMKVADHLVGGWRFLIALWAESYWNLPTALICDGNEDHWVSSQISEHDAMQNDPTQGDFWNSYMCCFVTQHRHPPNGQLFKYQRIISRP